MVDPGLLRERARFFMRLPWSCDCSDGHVARTNDRSAEPLSWPLRAARLTALTLLALTAAVMLLALLKEQFFYRHTSSPFRRSESPFVYGPWQHPGTSV
jgi:hypothetical protein